MNTIKSLIDVLSIENLKEIIDYANKQIIKHKNDEICCNNIFKNDITDLEYEYNDIHGVINFYASFKINGIIYTCNGTGYRDEIECIISANCNDIMCLHGYETLFDYEDENDKTYKLLLDSSNKYNMTVEDFIYEINEIFENIWKIS